MLFRSLVAASALSLSASAFLVVPEVQQPNDLPVTHALELEDAQSEKFQLLCDDCPFPETVSDGIVRWTENTKSSLELNFHAENGNLYVNDAHIFPVTFNSVETVKAVQRRESDGKETEPLTLGFALMALPLAPPQDDLELLQIRFSPLDIDGHPAPLDTVSITAIRTTAGELFILRAEVELPAGEDDHASWKECNGDTECLRHLIFDRIRALVQAAQAHMMNLKSKLGFGKGCHGKSLPGHRKAGHHGPGFGEVEEGHQPPHPHHRHRHMHGLRRTLFAIIRFVIVPAVLGIFAGLTASAIGMLVGQAVVFLWMRYRRGSKNIRSTSSLEQGTESEKAILIMEEEVSNEEDLPPYNDEHHALDAK
ncbi:conserved hypothetical protein [Talaromyces stipitatus ATCC 10500]|uniref:DUF7728 domain-containing protein n=1 Tax=Talaromyces stipitatus (strain ATCC 10500 / CBS 375.48 / QM 6759 / NRRL 1006) TaxID=441959 RepID=B8MR35_TALSN|nr:uncharacterized protein TSTA_054420 [Talaromyces stipitatus ATCC 10500]EED12930.1 conserved hypothetical protein [Talaromyces stipitatus ATCC 10500]